MLRHSRMAHPDIGKRPSLWRTALVIVVVATAAVWAYAWYQSVRQAEGVIVVAALILTPITIVGGVIAGALVYALRVARYNARIRQAVEDTPLELRRELRPEIGGAPAATAPEREQDRARRCATIAAIAFGWYALGAAQAARSVPSIYPVAAIGGVVALVFAYAAWGIARRPSRSTFGFAFGLAWTSAALLTVAALAITSLGIFAGVLARLQALALPFALAAGSGGMIGLIAALVASVELGRSTWRLLRGGIVAEPRWKAAVACVVVAFIVMAAVRQQNAARRTALGRQARTVSDDSAAFAAMIVSVDQLVGCSRAYALANPKLGYPWTTASLGPGGTGCVDQSTASGRPTELWQIRYTSNAPNAGRHADRYWLLASPSNPLGPFVYVDTAGAMYRTAFRDRADSVLRTRMRFTSAAPAISIPPAADVYVLSMASPAAALLDLQSCVLGIRQRHADTLGLCRTLRSTKDGSSTTEYVAQATISPGLVTDVARYAITVSPSASGIDSSFQIVARPARYGADGLRSFLVDEAKAVHWTSEDRLPTAEDPLVNECELKPVACRIGGDGPPRT